MHAHPGPRFKGVDAARRPHESQGMTALAVVLLIIGVVLLLFGIFVEAAQFLLWVGIVILVVAIIIGLMRYIRRET